MGSTEATALSEDDVIDEARYLNDLEYRRKIHEDLEIEGDEPMDLSFAEDEDLAFDGGDYPTEEAAAEALKKFIDDIFKEVLDEIAAEGGIHAARTPGHP